MMAKKNVSAPAAPKFKPWFVRPEKDDASSQLQRQVIGWCGLLLSPALCFVNWWRPAGEAASWEPLESISAYAYTGAVAVLTGVLAALAVFLLTYRGYQNEGKRRDRTAAIVAGLAAIGGAVGDVVAIVRFAL